MPTGSPRSAARQPFRSFPASAWPSVALPDVAAVAAPTAPLDGGGPCEVAGVREGRHHHHVALLQPTIGDGPLEVDRDSRGEQVAALIKGVGVSLLGKFHRITPVP